MKLLSRQGLRDRGIAYSDVHIWRLERADQFPKRVRLGSNRIAWVEAEIDKWLAEKIAARETA